jgi:pimeloyl-ACP methyl ester carboxylesterase
MPAAVTAAKPSEDFVISGDGTRLRRLRWGDGGASLVIVHGGMQAAHSHRLLALSLAERFTVHCYDRRGRGASGPAGASYSLEKECQDLAAILDASGARQVFGHSSGALIALQGALTLPIGRVALYEPPLSLGGSVPTAWLPRFEEQVARHDTAAAMITAATGLGLLSAPALLPRWLLVRLLRLMLRQSARDSHSWAAGMDRLVPTQRLDMQLVRELESSAERFRALPAAALLLGGSRAPAFLRRGLDTLEATLPHVQRIEFPRLTHNAPDDSTAAAHKIPITAALERFFAA